MHVKAMRKDNVSTVESSSDSEDEIDHLHRIAKEALDKAKLKPYPVFAIRSNIAFNAELLAHEDCPLPGQMVTFGLRDYLHVKGRFNADWWIGRLVRIGSNHGFIPSPGKIDMIRTSLYSSSSMNPAANTTSTTAVANNTSANPNQESQPLNKAAGGMFESFDENQENIHTNPVERPLVFNPAKKASSTAGPIQNQAASRRYVPELDEDGGIMTESMENDNFDSGGGTGGNSNAMNTNNSAANNSTNATKTNPNAPATGLVKKKPFAKKQTPIQAYELVPSMRPVVFVGPALKGFEVTDMMQKAIFDFLRKQFEGRLIMTRINSDMSQLKRLISSNVDTNAVSLQQTSSTQITTATSGTNSSNTANNPPETPAASLGATNAASTTNLNVIPGSTPGIHTKKSAVSMLHLQQEIERIFELSQQMQLVVLDADSVNHPSQIGKTCLAPIIIYIKIVSMKVLSRLIKNRGKSQKNNASFQLSAAEKLQQCADESFDLILDQNNLEGASECLRHFLETYWTATHPTNAQNKTQRILGCRDVSMRKLSKAEHEFGSSAGGTDSNSCIIQPGLQAGFTPREMLALVGQTMSWVVSKLSCSGILLQSNCPNQIGNGNITSDLTSASVIPYDWGGGDPEEYRSDREMRVDQHDRSNTSSLLRSTGGAFSGKIPPALGGDDTLTPLIKPVHPDIFLSKMSLKSQLLTHTASSNHMAPMNNHESEPTKIYTSRSILQQKQRLAEMEQKKKAERDLARQRRKQVRLIMEGGGTAALSGFTGN